MAAILDVSPEPNEESFTGLIHGCFLQSLQLICSLWFLKTF